MSADPRILGLLLHVRQTGELSADPHVEASAVALGLIYRLHAPHEGLRLTARGRRVLRKSEGGA